MPALAARPALVWAHFVNVALRVVRWEAVCWEAACNTDVLCWVALSLLRRHRPAEPALSVAGALPSYMA